MYISAFPALSFREFFVGPASRQSQRPLNPREVLYYRGANAVYHAVKLLNLSADQSVLVPAFHCGVEIEAVLAAGAKIKFYNVNEDLTVDFPDLIAQADQNTKAVLVIHYFGFSQNIRKIKEVCEQKGLILIEDCAHAFLSASNGQLLGSSGDLSIFSYQKSLPVPDGGSLLVNNSKFALPAFQGAPSNLTSLRGAMLMFREHAHMFYGWFYQLANIVIFEPAKFVLRLIKSQGKDQTVVTVSSSHDFNSSLRDLGISNRAKQYLQSVDGATIIKKRRENYSYLVEKLREVIALEIFVTQLPGGVCPLFLPIRVKNRQGLRKRLTKVGIQSFLFGEHLHKDLPVSLFPSAKRCSEDILCLPIHQDLTQPQLDYLAQKVIESLTAGEKKVDVLHFISSGGFFGAERVILSLAEQSRKQGQRVAIAALEDERAPHLELVKAAASAGIPTYTIKSRGRFDFSVVAALRNYIKENKFNVLHTHNYKSNILGLMAARQAGIKIVSTAHGFIASDQKVSLYECLDRFLLRNFFAKVIVVSDTVNVGVSRNKKKIIRNGIDIAQFRNHPEAREKIRARYGIVQSDTVIGTVGRLSIEKNQELLLEAAANVMREIGNVRVVIVGNGPQEEILKSIAKKLGIEQKVIFAGFIENPAPYYQAFDIFVLSSTTEGVPISILEAMASGVSIVATRVGGIPQIIEDGRTGMLVNSRDAQALSEQLARLIRNSAEREALARAAFEFVKKQYSVEQMWKSTNDVYREVI